MAAIESHPIPGGTQAQSFSLDTERRRGMARKDVARIMPHRNGSLVKLSPLEEFLIATMSRHLSITNSVL